MVETRQTFTAKEVYDAVKVFPSGCADGKRQFLSSMGIDVDRYTVDQPQIILGFQYYEREDRPRRVNQIDWSMVGTLLGLRVQSFVNATRDRDRDGTVPTEMRCSILDGRLLAQRLGGFGVIDSYVPIGPDEQWPAVKVTGALVLRNPDDE